MKLQMKFYKLKNWMTFQDWNLHNLSVTIVKKKSAENGHSRKLISHKEINCINGKEVNYSWCSLDHFLSMKSQFDSDLIVFSGDDFFLLVSSWNWGETYGYNDSWEFK